MSLGIIVMSLGLALLIGAMAQNSHFLSTHIYNYFSTLALDKLGSQDVQLGVR